MIHRRIENHEKLGNPRHLVRGDPTLPNTPELDDVPVIVSSSNANEPAT
jgi:hypothetical protein